MRAKHGNVDPVSVAQTSLIQVSIACRPRNGVAPNALNVRPQYNAIQTSVTAQDTASFVRTKRKFSCACGRKEEIAGQCYRRGSNLMCS